MAHITTQEAQAWAEGTKLTISSIDANLEPHIAEEVIDRLSSVTDVTTWTDQTTTPKLVRTIISKMYVAWIYNRIYSEDIATGSAYSDKLTANAEMLITGILDGTITIPGVTATGSGVPGFYPTDASSGQDPTSDDTSLGPAAFSMGKMF